MTCATRSISGKEGKRRRRVLCPTVLRWRKRMGGESSSMAEKLPVEFSDAGRQWFISNPCRHWPERFRCSNEMSVLLAVAAVDWLLPDWTRARHSETAPVRAADAARSHPRAQDENLRRHARALAKACTSARARSLGYEHRIAEAARAVALASAATSDSATVDAVSEALSKVEEHALYVFAVKGVYGKEPEVRACILSLALRTLGFPEPPLHLNLPPLG